MTRIYDAQIGARARDMLSRDARLTVVAVHSESVYACGEEGRLLLLCPDKYGSVPFGVSVSEYFHLRENYSFSVGDELVIEKGEILCPCGDRIILSERETCSTGRSNDSIPDAARVFYCAEYVRQHASERGIGPALPAFLCIAPPLDTANAYALSAVCEADRFESAFLCGDTSALDHAVGRFVGLGYGLTPSGDDFLCGMLYAFHRYSRVSDRSEQYLCLLSDSVERHVCDTNKVSAEYIRCALDGEYFEVVEDVFDSLHSFDKSNIHKLETALSRLLAVGASSGSDILCGILFAVYLLW